MEKPDDQLSLDQVLANMAWIRRLAQRLVGDAADRDDVVQEVWLEALTHSPGRIEPRPWLAGVLKNVVRMRYRGATRRRQRERAVEASAQSPAVQSGELVERVQIERAVAAALLAVTEPYRTTLLLRYYDDLSAAEIARRIGAPAATVRWRLQRGLEQLRGQLDARFGNDRRGWCLALVPTAVAARADAAKTMAGTIASTIVGGMIMKAVAISATVAALLVALGWGLQLTQRQHEGGDVGGARPGAAWRVAGGFGAVGLPAATVAGVSIPAWFGQPGAAVRRIAGQVTFQGAPAAGAVVELGSELSDAAVLPAARRVTGADGRFDFGLQPPAQYRVAASAERRTPAVRLVDARNPAANSERLELMLGGCEAALFGQVSDSSGGPIVGAQLCYAPPRAAACVVSGENGRYEMCVSPQQQQVDVSAKGYGAVQEPTFFSSRRVRRDFVLTPEAILVGRVVRARDGSAIAGADVRSVGGEPGLRLASSTATVTDAQGHFTLTGLAPGRHRLIARAAGLATSDAVDVSVEAGRTSPEILLRLGMAARLHGVVVDDGRRPIAGALVSIASGAAKVERMPGVDAVTQADGSFVLDAVPQGTVTFVVAGQDVLEPKSLLVKEASVDSVRLVVRALGSIAGRVTRKGLPVAGAQVGCGLFAEPVFSENDGSYVLGGLRRQACRVVASDHRTGVCGLSPLVELAAGEQRAGVDVEMDWAGAIAGTVVEEDGTPAASVQVRFTALHASDGGEAVTGPDGKFRVGTLRGGDDYRGDVLESAASRHHLAPADGEFALVHVDDGQSEVAGIRLVVKRSHAAIAGHVVDDSGQPASDVQVTAFRAAAGEERQNLNESFNAPRTISTADGSFRIDDVDSGTFVLVAHGGDGSEGRLAGIAAGQSGVTLRLQATGGIDGKLVGFDSPPEVTAFKEAPFTPRARAYGFVDGDTFHFRGLPPGTYVVDAAGNGGEVATVEVAGGQNAVVTLRNRGTATIHGRVVEWRSGSGVPGMTCKSMLFGGRTFSRPQGQPTFTDDSGAFTLEGVPAGPSIVICFGDPASSDGLTKVDVAAGGAATCQVVVVKGRATDTLGFFGGEIGVDSSLAVSILSVLAGSPAAKAGIRRGDVLAMVDGLSVQALSPIGNEFAIRDRPVGQSVPIGVLRGGQPITTNVVIGSAAGF